MSQEIRIQNKHDNLT